MAKNSRAGQGPRLNDTNDLMRGALPGEGTHSVSVRKVENGYVSSTSSYDATTGNHASFDTFHRDKPKVLPARVVSKGSDSGNSLREARDYLRGKK